MIRIKSQVLFIFSIFTSLYIHLRYRHQHLYHILYQLQERSDKSHLYLLEELLIRYTPLHHELFHQKLHDVQGYLTLHQAKRYIQYGSLIHIRLYIFIKTANTFVLG